MGNYTEPELSRSALLTIDMQYDFTLPGASAEVPGTYAILPNLGSIAQAYRLNGLPIIHVVRLYLPDGSNAELCRRTLFESGTRIVCPGTDGAELVNELKPSPALRLDSAKLLAGGLQTVAKQEWILYKPRWGAFYNTPLESHLHSLRINSLTLVGCNYPNCPRATLIEASERDFRILLVEDAISGLYERGKQELQNIGVHFSNTPKLLNQLSQL
jgi:nicotinamidase-related amidase